MYHYTNIAAYEVMKKCGYIKQSDNYFGDIVDNVVWFTSNNTTTKPWVGYKYTRYYNTPRRCVTIRLKLKNFVIEKSRSIFGGKVRLVSWEYFKDHDGLSKKTFANIYPTILGDNPGTDWYVSYKEVSLYYCEPQALKKGAWVPIDPEGLA